MSEGYDRVAHLGFIQGAINRMAGNSFFCKGWAVTLFSALSAFVVSAEGSHVLCVPWLLAAAVLVFWWMDSWYLRMERLFRRLYDRVRLGDEAGNPYDMSFKPFMGEEQCVFRIMFSRSTLPVYSVMLVAALVLFLIRRGC